jgi:7,8-dihydropterin-6-yl-methyl-4-(beta-D-ribofuranosyl)aminobenzene 5'-phosphate synthase
LIRRRKITARLKPAPPFLSANRDIGGEVAAVGWEPDPWLIDERWLGVNVSGKGLVVFSACSHAGVINVLKDARAQFQDIPLHTVLGGFHLSGPTEKIIPETVDALRDFCLTTIAAGHCTGWRAMAALTNAFGDKIVTPTAVGKRFVF